MAHRRNDRWTAEEPFSLSPEARGADERELPAPRPVRAWIQFPSHLMRVECVATTMTPDAVRVEWGERSTRQSAWVWRAAVKNRAVSDAEAR